MSYTITGTPYQWIKDPCMSLDPTLRTADLNDYDDVITDLIEKLLIKILNFSVVGLIWTQTAEQRIVTWNINFLLKTETQTLKAKFWLQMLADHKPSSQQLSIKSNTPWSDWSHCGDIRSYIFLALIGPGCSCLALIGPVCFLFGSDWPSLFPVWLRLALVVSCLSLIGPDCFLFHPDWPCSSLVSVIGPGCFHFGPVGVSGQLTAAAVWHHISSNWRRVSRKCHQTHCSGN